MNAIQITWHGVLAGAYKGKSASLKTTLYHASKDGGETSLCGKVKPNSLADEAETQSGGTCAACRRLSLRMHMNGEVK